MSLMARLHQGPYDGQLREVASLVSEIAVDSTSDTGSYKLRTDPDGVPLLTSDGTNVFIWQPSRPPAQAVQAA